MYKANDSCPGNTSPAPLGLQSSGEGTNRRQAGRPPLAVAGTKRRFGTGVLTAHEGLLPPWLEG
jgi:hypothetical protein